MMESDDDENLLSGVDLYDQLYNVDDDAELYRDAQHAG